MSKWAEIEKTAIQFRTEEAERLYIIRQQVADEVRLKNQKETAEAAQILKDLKVEELLGIIRYEVWKEGNVGCGNDAKTHIWLLSDPLIVLGKTNDDGLELRSERTSIKVEAKFEADQPVVETYMSWYSPPRTLPVVQRILSRGTSTDELGLSNDSVRERFIATTEDDSTYKNLCERLYEYQTRLENRNALPSNARSWTNALMQDFPTDFRNPGDTMSAEQRRKWVMENRDRKLPAFLDRPVVNLFAKYSTW